MSRKHKLVERGDYPVVCDICGFERWRSECTVNYKGLLVCSDTCLETRHPSETFKLRHTMQKSRLRRPDPEDKFLAVGEITVDDL